MKQDLISKLVCPIDKSELDLQIFSQDINKNIIEGIFTCTKCKRYYPVVHGIPIMSPDEYREPALENPILKKWELGKNSNITFLNNEEIIS